MANRFEFDLEAEYPDVIIDTMRRAVLGAVTDLRAQIARIDDASGRLTTALTRIGAAQQALAAGKAERDQLRADLTALTARVAALEAAVPPPPGGSP